MEDQENISENLTESSNTVLSESSDPKAPVSFSQKVYAADKAKFEEIRKGYRIAADAFSALVNGELDPTPAEVISIEVEKEVIKEVIKEVERPLERNQFVIDFDEKLLLAIRFLKKRLIESGLVKTDNPSDLVNQVLKEYIKNKYGIIID